MPGTIPKAAEMDTLTDLVANELPSWYMRLFSGNFTPDANTTLANMLANEANFAGYAPKPLTTWSAPSIDGTNAAISTSTQGVFVGTGTGGTGPVYGYFLVNGAGTKFYAVERFTGAPLSQPQGVNLEIDVTYSYITRY